MDIRELGQVSNTAALYVVEAGNRLFGLTFGLGRYLLNEAACERRFGLLTTLNSVPPNGIRSLDKATFDPLHRQTKTQANRTATAQEFGLDVEQDLLRGITGIPSDHSLGPTMSGLHALHVNADVSLSTLPVLLLHLLKQFRATTYKKNFPWVDNISEIADLSMMSNLDSLLVGLVQSEDWKSVQLVLPEIIDWTRIAGFTYGRRKNNARHVDVNIKHWHQEIDLSSSIDIDTLHRSTVNGVSEDWDTIYSWSVYGCLYAELTVGDDQFVLSSGAWYKLEKDFVDVINRGVSAIPKYKRSLPMCGVATEGLYNASVAKQVSSYCLMDRKLVSRGGGRSSIEFCDLFSDDKEIVHVKWYGGSAVLSHLFSQGLVAGELFASDDEFRKLLNPKLAAGFRLKNPAKRPEPSDYTIVFAIIDCDRPITQLPFFSRVNLRSAAQRLAGIGYKVSFASIPLDPILKVTSTAKAPKRRTKKT